MGPVKTSILGSIYFCINTALQPTKRPTKGERVLWIRVLLIEKTKRRGRFVKNPDSHVRDTGFCIIHEQLRNSSTHYKWDKASDGVVLQYSETTDYSTIYGTRAGGCSCRRNSCHCHRSPHPTEELLAWSEMANLRRQTKWVSAFLSRGRATCLPSVCCGYGRFLMAVELRTTWQVTNETTDPHDKHNIFCTRPHSTPDFSYSYTCP